MKVEATMRGMLSMLVAVVISMAIGTSLAWADEGQAEGLPFDETPMAALDGETEIPSIDSLISSEGIDALRDAIAKVREIASDANATQEVREQAQAALEKAMNEYLAKAGITDAASLEKALQDVAKLYTDNVVVSANGSDVPTSKYWVTKEAQDGLTAAFSQVTELIQKEGATPAEYGVALAGLREAASAYVPKPGTLEPATPEPETPDKPAVVDKSKLKAALDKATKAIEDVVESVDGSDVAPDKFWVTKNVKKALQTAVADARKALDLADVKQDVIDAAEAAVTAAHDIFDAAKRAGTKVEPKPEPEPEPEPQPGPAAWTRLAGPSALDTMSAIVDAGKFAKGGTVVLASLEGYWDALTAAGIAGLEDAPVLMVLQDDLGAQTEAQLEKLAPKKIIVCGGTYWIPDFVVVEACNAAGLSWDAATRLAGDNAAITAAKIAEAGKGKWSETAIVATAGTFQDALAAAPVSYAKGMPIFLAQYDSATEKGYIDKSTIDAMKAAGVKQCYIAGGEYWLPKAVTDDLNKAGIEVLDQLGGKSAVETSGMIAELATGKLGMSADNMGAANVDQHYDALASAAFCGKNNSVLVLVRDANRSVVDTFVKPNAAKIGQGYVFGGTGSVSDASMAALQSATK